LATKTSRNFSNVGLLHLKVLFLLLKLCHQETSK
jgi:hypothetical protein